MSLTDCELNLFLNIFGDYVQYCICNIRTNCEFQWIQVLCKHFWCLVRCIPGISRVPDSLRR